MKLGKMVKTVTNALGIEQCGACKEREKALDEFSDKVGAFFAVKKTPETPVPSETKS